MKVGQQGVPTKAKWHWFYFNSKDELIPAKVENFLTANLAVKIEAFKFYNSLKRIN